MVFQETFFLSRRSSGHLECCFNRSSDQFTKKTKKNKKLFLFFKTINSFPQNLPLNTQDAVSKTILNFLEESQKILAQNPVLMKQCFCRQNISVDTKTENFTVVENRLVKVLKLFVRSPGMTNKRVVISWKKTPTRKPSRYVEFSFNIFLIKFRTIITKKFAQKLQQNFSLDKLTHI